MAKTKQKELIVDLTQGPVARQLIRFALPIMGANLMQALYTLVDLWVVGNFATSAAISAVSVAGQVVFLMHAVGIGLGNGGQVLISQQIGAKDTKNLGKSVGTLITFAIISSVIISIIGALGRNLWMNLMQVPEEALWDSIQYLLICCIGVPFVYAQGTFCAILRGVGESKTPMYVLGLSTIINIVLDLLFVGAWHMGAAGAAWATIIAQIISTAYATVVIYRNRKTLGFDFKLKSFRMDGAMLKIILKLSTPLIIMSASVNLSMMVVTAFVNAYGVAASAITGIGGKISSMVNVVTGGMQTAVGSMVAQNFAAGKTDRVKKINRVSFILCMLFFIVVGALSLLIPRQIIGIFSSDPDVLALAGSYMLAACVLYLSFCMMTTSIGHINGVGFTSLNLLIALLDSVIGRIGLSILFGKVLNWGVAGYWWGNAISAYISVIMGIGYYLFGHWEKRNILI